VPGLFYYTARNEEGKFLHGSLEAGTRTAALAALRARAVFVTSLEDAGTTRGLLASGLQFGGIRQKDIVAFFRSFATLVGAGVPIRRSLDVTMEQCGDSGLREALAFVRSDIENGLSLSDALARRPQEFPPLFVVMVKAGESGGVLEQVLDRLASALERDRKLRKQVASALAYPAVVLVFALALIVFLITSIVPMFQSMYEQLHVPLPWITSLLIRVGTMLHSRFPWICISTAAIVVIFLHISRAPAPKSAFNSIVASVPVIGAIMRKSTVARVARMLGTLLGSGVSLMTALSAIEDIGQSVLHRRSMASLQRALREGTALSEAFAESRLYEPMFIQMVHVGEETGALGAMLVRIADYYDVDVEAALNTLGSVLEPALIVLLGGAVGFIIAAIFIPLYTLVGNIK
jgi:type IV pilus assembly protein PilC